MQKKREAKAKLPALFFFEDHYDTGVYATLIKLLPDLKYLGYDTVCFESMIGCDTLDSNILTIKEMSSLSPSYYDYLLAFCYKEFGDKIKELSNALRAGKDFAEFLALARHENLKMSFPDLSLNQFKKEMPNVEGIRKIFGEKLTNELENDILLASTKNLTGLNLEPERKATLLNVVENFTSYCSNSGKYRRDKNSIVFFDRRTRCMAKTSSQLSKEGNVITIVGYRHKLHQYIEEPPSDKILSFIIHSQNWKTSDADILINLLELNKVTINELYPLGITRLKAENNPELFILSMIKNSLKDSSLAAKCDDLIEKYQDSSYKCAIM